ncbi:gp41 [Burkholderia pseudomallei]|nr:gp41 [Burkholderia pseudomallei]
MTNETKPRANGIVNLTQYAFELVGAVDRLPESPQRDEVLKQAKALRLDLATATRESLFDGFVSLEGLRAKLLAPREIQRDEQGWLTHPELPLCDEDVRVDRFLETFGIESAFISMESDVDAESYEQYHEHADATRWRRLGAARDLRHRRRPSRAVCTCNSPQGAPRSHTAYNGADRAHTRRTSRLSGGVRRR